MSNPNGPNPQSGGQMTTRKPRVISIILTAIRMAIHTVPANPIRTIPTANGSP